MPNIGEGILVRESAQPLASYPHARKVNGFIFVSGISSRRFDNTYAGVTELPDGTYHLDIKEQTKAVIEK
jgi:2-aminomuconate deaminase